MQEQEAAQQIAVKHGLKVTKCPEHGWCVHCKHCGNQICCYHKFCCASAIDAQSEVKKATTIKFIPLKEANAKNLRR